MRPPASTQHVLLVEQDEDILDLFAGFFGAHGYRVSTARGAREALACAREAPDVIFSSLVFSDMNGFDLCWHLRRLPQTANSLIFALTGYCETGIHQKVAAAGFDDYLLKPVRLQTLLDLAQSRRKGRGGIAGIAFAGQSAACHREGAATSRMASASH